MAGWRMNFLKVCGAVRLVTNDVRLTEGSNESVILISDSSDIRNRTVFCFEGNTRQRLICTLENFNRMVHADFEA